VELNVLREVAAKTGADLARVSGVTQELERGEEEKQCLESGDPSHFARKCSHYSVKEVSSERSKDAGILLCINFET
jgi:hypothetical protein